MTEKCLRCESTTESHNAMFLQWHQESNFADRSCRATDERHGGIALRATGDRETDLGGGGGISGQEEIYAVIWVDEVEANARER
jgi:hypothetical protein